MNNNYENEGTFIFCVFLVHEKTLMPQFHKLKFFVLNIASLFCTC